MSTIVADDLTGAAIRHLVARDAPRSATPVLPPPPPPPRRAGLARSRGRSPPRRRWRGCRCGDAAPPRVIQEDSSRCAATWRRDRRANARRGPRHAIVCPPSTHGPRVLERSPLITASAGRAAWPAIGLPAARPRAWWRVALAHRPYWTGSADVVRGAERRGTPRRPRARDGRRRRARRRLEPSSRRAHVGVQLLCVAPRTGAASSPVSRLPRVEMRPRALAPRSGSRIPSHAPR